MIDTGPRATAGEIGPAKFRRTLLLGVLVPPALQLALAALFLWQINRLMDQAEWVDHTDVVIAQAHNAQRLLVEMQTGMRGYLLTGARRFLQPYDRAGAEVGPVLDGLDRLVADNPEQGHRLAAIRLLAGAWRPHARDLIDRRERGDET